MAVWPYNTAAWKKLRLVKLATNPLCEVCAKRDRLAAASHVDHIVAINQGGEAFPELSGLMSMCPSCHSIKTQAKDRKGGSGVAFKGCDAEGNPIDPGHPALGDAPRR
ncbi:HNH endonuclease signature motif containing protein [Rhodovulum sp. DZ06]|uniref:HNH endonuclease signature motif containing protein n=1 Tax=Rhodovulum sp. DZ06 TaxID=3425126 RepID=UPI003D34CA2E